MLLAMAIVVCEMIPLVFQRIKGFVFDLPPGASSPHEVKDVALTYAQVCHPAEVLDLGRANLPVLNEIDPHLDVRGIEWHIIDKPKAMDHPCGVVVSLIQSAPSGVLRRLHLLEEIGMITCFDTKNIVQPMRVQRLDVWSIGTQTVFSDDELEVGVVLTQLGHKSFGRSAFTIIFVRPVVLHDGLWHQGNHFTPVWMNNCSAQQLMKIRDRTMTVDFVQT